MRIVGIMPVRNEDWILGFSLRVALKWCDAVAVMLHACDDRSEWIAREVFGETERVSFISDMGGEWREMEQRQKTLEWARNALHATHIALVDADEVLTANLVPCIRRLVEDTPTNHMLDLPLYNIRGSLTQYHSNGIWGNRWVAAAFQDRPELHWAGDQFHHREPMGNPLPPAPRWQRPPRVLGGWQRYNPVQQDSGGVLHFWGASERRLRAKHALYKITERIRFPKKTAREIDDYYSLAIVPREPWHFATVRPEWLAPEWLAGYEDLMAEHLHVDAEPWQEAECKRLYQEYGAKMFDGLDLFGVAP
jgi:hypothetical protein